MSKLDLGIGGRYGFRSGSFRAKNVQVDQRLQVAGNEMPIMPMSGDVFYVDTNISASGNGKSWGKAFKTITAGIAALGNYDTLIIGPGNYDEAALISLDDKTGVRIFGSGTGMQWGEGQTCWRDVTSTLDLLNLSGNKGVEIAGICFINVTSGKDAINFDGLNYSVHIHDCSFIGDVGSGAVQAYGINAGGSNSADLYVHDCRFLRQLTTGIFSVGQRAVIQNCFFVVAASAKGIDDINAASGYNLVSDCYFLGANSSDVGIDMTPTTAGRNMVTNCHFSNCATTMTGGSTGAEANACLNYGSTAAGGVLIDPT